MKVAVSGKGGVGKSTLTGALALLHARRGSRVLAVDADPDANLAACLGMDAERQREIVPISRQLALIEERTGAKVREYGQIFRLNPEVSDIADSYATLHDGVALLVLGAVERGGSGCACPENVLIRALVADLVLYRDEALFMDMEAGVEHLGRATARGVDTMLLVVEPGQRSIASARRVIAMAGEIGLEDARLVANKVTGPEDEAFIRGEFPDHELLGVIPYAEEIRRSDRDGRSVLDGLSAEVLQCFEGVLSELQREAAG
jgi:CO dehydrogenase maturation factor